MKLELIDQPLSGAYQERVYDIPSEWNSSNWTWVKFTNETSDIVGQFRGAPKTIKHSEGLGEIMVLTSDYIYRLDASSLEIIETESQPQYQGLWHQVPALVLKV